MKFAVNNFLKIFFKPSRLVIFLDVSAEYSPMKTVSTQRMSVLLRVAMDENYIEYCRYS